MTKQLNKKGTSLVELIAVIVIMGIIAGIAVPVTISVINRQKLNAAAKSAEALVTTVKNTCSELSASVTGTTITITLKYTPGDGVIGISAPDTTDGVSITSGTGDDFTGYGADDFKVENLKAKGTLKAVYTLSTATYSFTETTAFYVNGYKITINADGSCKAAKAS